MPTLARRPAEKRRLLSLAEAFAQTGLTVPQIAAELGVTDRHVWRLRQQGLSPYATRMRTRLLAWLFAKGIDPATVVVRAVMADDDVPDLATERRKRLRTAPIAPTDPDPRQEETPLEITSRLYLDPETLTHFGLLDDPFADSEDPEDVFLHPRLQQVENAMLKAVLRRQILVLVGEPGSGKSTLLRRLHGRMGREKKVRLIAPASLDRRRITHAALSVAILRDLIGKDTSGSSMEGRSELLRRTLQDQIDAGLFPALLIDEGHLLKVDALLALKQLWDSYTSFRALAVIVIGQPLLERSLKQNPEVRELTGRAQILRIDRLSEGEVGGYLRWRFDRLGAESARAQDVFDAGAFKALAVRAEHPLWVNNLAVRALQYAHQIGDTRVTATHVGRA